MEVIKSTPSNVDQLAENLANWALMGRNYPPSWDGAKHSFPVSGPQGERVGSILPGTGLYLDHDLKSLGINRRIPHVFQRSETCKITEALGSERDAIRLIAFRDRVLGYGHVRTDVARATIAAYDQIIAARAGGYANDVVVNKASITTVANVWYSSMLAAGGNIAALSGLSAGSGSASSGGSVMTRGTTGAWSLGINNPGGSNRTYLLTVGFTAVQQLNMILVCDFLVGVSGISTNSATNNVNTVALTRYGSSGSTNNAAGAGVWPVMEVTTAATAGAQNMGGTYTNQAGSGGTFPAQALLSAATVGRLDPQLVGPFIQLAVGDYGVQGVTTITTSAQLTTGVRNLYLVYPLMMIPGLAANIYAERDSTTQIDGICELVNASQVIGCLGVFVLSSTTSTGINTWFFRTCQG